MDTTVVSAFSTMTGAPSWSYGAGGVLPVFDAVLVDGFGSRTLNSLVVSDEVATCTISTGAGFSMLLTVGPVIEISGATPATLNGRWRVSSSPTGTTFTFPCPGVADGTATGTISCKFASAGWERVYTDTNKRVYRSKTTQGTRLYLRLYDDAATTLQVFMYETMSDVDTGTGSSGTRYWYKAVSSGAKPWRIFADDRTVYWFADVYNNNTWSSGGGFGDIASVVAGDLYNCMLFALSSASLSQNIGLFINNNALQIARDHGQTGGVAAPQLRSIGGLTICSGYSAGSIPDYPQDDLGILTTDFTVWQTTSPYRLRGKLPGILCMVNKMAPNLTGAATAIAFPGFAAGVGYIHASDKFGGSYGGGLFIDVGGPWR